MKILVEHMWNIQFDSLIKKLIDQKPTHLIWLGATEYNFPEDWAGDKMTILQNILVKNNIKLEFVTGCITDSSYLFDRLVAPKVNMTIHPFPLYWLYETVRAIPLSHPPQPLPNIENKSYINLNRNPHYFRCMLMDTLAKNNLLDKGYNTWLRPGIYDSNYDFKYWKEEKLTLKNDLYLINSPKDISHDLTNQCLPPPEYFSSTINLTCESTEDIIFYTEKTFKNFYYQKPFIILGAPYIHHMLKYWGFELYDEIFDYSFDTYPNIEDRVEGVVDNIKKISEINSDEIKQLVKYKVKHNYNRMMEIYYGKLYIPPIIEYFTKKNNPQISNLLRYAF